MEELGNAGHPLRTRVPPLLSTYPKSFTQPYHIQSSAGQGRGSDPETLWGCPMPKASPCLVSSLPSPIPAPSCPSISPGRGWAQPAELGAGRCQPALGEWGTQMPAVFFAAVSGQ